jgi:adenylyltransferase/sulfurtransferase
MNPTEESPIVIRSDRFARFEAIEWWDQSLLKQARILVIGAGAIGNEVIKNLALLGVGNIVIVDMDRVESSNLNRSILFRAGDEGRYKADCACEACKVIYPDARVMAIHGNVMTDIGLGYFRWAQVVVGALDNREARVFVNQACAQVNRPWIDGGIEIFKGVARGFWPPKSSCYECTMGQTDWQILNQRRSCSLLARRAILHNGVPTTPTIASIIGAIQAQEVVKLLHDQEALIGKGFFYDGQTHDSYTLDYPIHPGCPWHEGSVAIEALPDVSGNNPVGDLWDEAAKRLGGVDAIDLSREYVGQLRCPRCERRENLFQATDAVDSKRLICNTCQTELIPEFFHSIPPDRDLLKLRIDELGLPVWDIVWARYGNRRLGLEIAGKSPLGVSD